MGTKAAGAEDSSRSRRALGGGENDDGDALRPCWRPLLRSLPAGPLIWRRECGAKEVSAALFVLSSALLAVASC